MPLVKLPSTPMVNFQLKFKDVYSAKWFYEQKMEYLRDHQWESVIPCSTPIPVEFEVKYEQQQDPRGSRNIWYHWRLQKTHKTDLRIPLSIYLRWYLDVDVQIIGLSDHEVMIDGKKHSVHKGENILYVKAWIIADPDGEWEKHWLLKRLKGMWEERLYGAEYAVSRERLIKEVYEFQDWMKRYFKLKRWIRGGGDEFRPGISFPSHIKKSE